jgi:hypothetical protein
MTRLSLTFFALAALTACGHTPDPIDTGVVADSLCAQDKRADVYMPGMVKMGTDVEVKLLDSNPAPPIKGTNDWRIEVDDASGHPMDGATIKVVPFMPDHGHGTSVTPTIAPLGQGDYSVSSVYLFMPGLWQVTIFITPQGQKTMTSVVYNFCVDG